MSAMKAIYALARDLQIDEDDRRDLYQRVTGKRSLSDMSAEQQLQVASELRRLLDRPGTGRVQLTGPYAKKLQALWIAGWNLGLVRNREDSALIAFVKRQTGIDHVRFLRDPFQATKAVEALKDWLRRDGGVVWDTQGYGWFADHGAKIAWAQWRLLHPEATLLQIGGFKAEAARLAGRAARQVPLSDFTSADWRAVCNALGHRVRRISQ
jgi:hypothetical protein